MVDTHCHLDAERFEADRALVLERAWSNGLVGIVVPAVGPDSWDALLSWPTQDERLHVALGIHPQMLPHLPEKDDGLHLERLDGLLARGIAVAVGECGLDGPSAAGAPVERQLKVLAGHLRLAQKHHLPILVHCHRVHPAMVEFLKENELPEAGWLMHSYSGGPDLAKFYSGRGCFFSFAGPVTWPEARKPLDSVRAIGLSRLMVETDAPDQAPYPHRGQRSEPGYLPRVVEGMAKALGVSASEVAETTTENARKFFNRPFSPSG